eukprot:CAMPEP_0171602788 /NCGR_PEP_ID=MMETSP0990-20121206/5663_1 /TAXON_ID=483369 /ORGANISM="non described non described, Strain CCMP2098" /LENGTH=187 /DNA_ID=CAMNT_0012165075 /DNA_START=48 /DNA_END=611 /DNA_ORIENTATION=+
MANGALKRVQPCVSLYVTTKAKHVKEAPVCGCVQKRATRLDVALVGYMYAPHAPVHPVHSFQCRSPSVAPIESVQGKEANGAVVTRRDQVRPGTLYLVDREAGVHTPQSVEALEVDAFHWNVPHPHLAVLPPAEEPVFPLVQPSHAQARHHWLLPRELRFERRQSILVLVLLLGLGFRVSTSTTLRF